jgi:hypothetical protein
MGRRRRSRETMTRVRSRMRRWWSLFWWRNSPSGYPILPKQVHGPSRSVGGNGNEEVAFYWGMAIYPSPPPPILKNLQRATPQAQVLITY